MDEMDKLALAEATLQEWIKLFGLCLCTVGPSGVVVVTPEMDAARCEICLPCRTRKVLEVIELE